MGVACCLSEFREDQENLRDQIVREHWLNLFAGNNDEMQSFGVNMADLGYFWRLRDPFVGEEAQKTRKQRAFFDSFSET